MSTLLELNWRLQSLPEHEATQLFERIRAGNETSLINTQDDTRASGSQSKQLNIPTTPSEQTVSTVPDVIVDPLQPKEHDFLEMRFPADPVVIEIGVKRFFMCLGPMFPITTAEIGQAISHEVLEPLQQHGLRSFLAESNHAEASRKRAALSELCGMAAVGLQYDQDNLPLLGRFDKQYMAEPDDVDYSDMLIRIAKCFLDDIIEINPLRAARTCALLVMWNIINHSTVALSYCGK